MKNRRARNDTHFKVQGQVFVFIGQCQKNGEIDHRNTQRGTDCTGHTTATTSQIGFMARLYERSHKKYRQYHITCAG
mgnify:CR=1 FL=1